MTRCQMCGTELTDATQRFCGGDTCDRVLMPPPRPAAAAWLGRALAVAVTLLLLLAVTRTAHGQVPTGTDIAACNEEAPRAVKVGSASPTSGDQARADTARRGSLTTTATEAPTGRVESSDPQIHGMQRAGAIDAAYQAAYRSCMRRKGF